MGHGGSLEVGEHAVQALIEGFGAEGWNPGANACYVESLEPDGEPTSCLFRWRHRRAIRGYFGFHVTLYPARR
jgi:hypothetical protein